MTKVLFLANDKGGVGKSALARAAAELLQSAAVIELDSSPRLLELSDRARFFPMRAERSQIESSGGSAARAEFDGVINEVFGATEPTILDIGANTARSLFSLVSDIYAADEVQPVSFGVVVVTTAEPGSLSEVPRLLSLSKAWSQQFLVQNQYAGPIAAGSLPHVVGIETTSLPNLALDEEAAAILQLGGLASIDLIDRGSLSTKFGFARSNRIWRDLVRARAELMRAIEPAARWLAS